MRSPSVRLPLAIVGAAFVFASPGFSTPVLSAGPPIAVGPLVATPVFSTKSLARLKMNGLLATDPQLKEHLTALARSKHKAPSAVHARLGKAVFKGKPTLYSAPAPIAQTVTSPTLTVTGPLITKITADYATVYVFGLNLMSPNGAQQTTADFTLGNCGSFSNVMFSLPTRGYIDVPTPARDVGATITVHVPGQGASKVIGFTLPHGAYDEGVTATAGISDTAPFFAGGDLGIPSSAFSSTLATDHISTDPSGSGGQGSDTIGLGVNLVNGWSATAAISNIHSYRDGPNEAGSNDDYRSATITRQPENGRLETRVAWSYDPGESITYDIIWSFTNDGSGFGRVTDKAAKVTRCSDEQ